MAKVIVMIRKHSLRQLFNEILVVGGYEVIFDTDDITVGIAKCKELRPDLIILDRDHFEVGKPYIPTTLKTIREFDKETAIIKVANQLGDNSWMWKTKEAGGNGVIVLPTTPEIALKAIKDYCPWL